MFRESSVTNICQNLCRMLQGNINDVNIGDEEGNNSYKVGENTKVNDEDVSRNWHLNCT